jgi:hypothetical protein
VSGQESREVIEVDEGDHHFVPGIVAAPSEDVEDTEVGAAAACVGGGGDGGEEQGEVAVKVKTSNL